MDRMSILVIEDEEAQRNLLAGLLSKEGYTASSAGDGKTALDLFKNDTFEVVLLDYKLPDTDGLTLLKTFKEVNPEVEVIMITAFGSIENAVTALKAGAFEYLTKPIDLDDLLFKIKKVEEKRYLVRENMVLKEALKDRLKSEEVIYTSEKMHQVMSLVVRVAKTDSTCLIEGESGTGKEKSLRKSELFGHSRDAPRERAFRPREGSFYRSLPAEDW
jgi:DNA-binding NtrC family response regulator